MTKRFIYAFFVLAFIYGCKSQEQPQDRIETIKEFFLAIENSDSAKLFALVDTASFFRVQNREKLDYILNYVNGKQRECPIKIADSIAVIKDGPVNTKQYTFPFCRDQAGEILYGESFDMQFTFKEYEHKNKISYIEMKVYPKPPTATIPPPEAN